ncbi:uncharacterized [Tachysurus ichikawai]
MTQSSSMKTDTARSSQLQENFPYFLLNELHKLHAVVKKLTRPSPPSVIYGSWERSGEKGKNKDVWSQSQNETEWYNEE